MNCFVVRAANEDTNAYYDELQTFLNLIRKLQMADVDLMESINDEFPVKLKFSI